MDIIRVRVAEPESNRVALWERHPAHPHGEVWLAGAGEYDVAATPAVMSRLRNGTLVKVDTVAAPAPEPVSTGERPNPEDDPQVERSVPGKQKARGRKSGVHPDEEPSEEASVITTVAGDGAPSSRPQRKARGS